MNRPVFAVGFIGALLALPPPTAHAADFYVDNSVSSSGNGASWGSAWKSFSQIAWSSVRPGDTIHLSGGGSGQ
ncbi:MAG TPA: hypothetical protein VD978_08535, partial [Azospirillum sp.]|nr:hypothetical protein [Azospirillum sp.]